MKYRLLEIKVEKAKKVLESKPKTWSDFSKLYSKQEGVIDSFALYNMMMTVMTYLICMPELNKFMNENTEFITKMSEFSSDSVIISINEGFMHIVADRFIPKGEIAVDLNRHSLFVPDRELRTIEISEGNHILHYHGGLTNHSCDPTCYVDNQSNFIRALRDINEGEEINFDYMINESEISSSFVCQCGSVKCVGTVGTEHSTPTYL